MINDIHAFQVYPMYSLTSMTKGDFFKNDYLNSIKYVIPGILILYGINSRERLRIAIWAILAFGLLLSMQVVEKMFPALIGADDLATRALRVLDRDIGYHRVNLAAMTAGFSWGFFALINNSRSLKEKAFGYTGLLFSTLAMILTGGRAGMLAWVGCGLILALIKWRKLILIGPIIGLLALVAVPGLYDRLDEGLGNSSGDKSSNLHEELGAVDSQGRDLYSMTSGRVIVWPLVIDKIKDNPLVGYGKRAMVRLGLTHQAAYETESETLAFGHPHNAYLELLLDCGIIGAIPVLLFYAILVIRALRELNNEDREVSMTAGIVLAFVLTQAIAAFGSQSFYPDEGVVAMWAAIGAFFAAISLQRQSSEEVDVKEKEDVRINYYR